MSNCPICGRKASDDMQNHHLKPKTFKTRTKEVHEPHNFVTIHPICHSAIHAFFKESDLYSYYHTVERIMENEDMQRFVKWIKKKDVDFYTTMKRSNKRKRKR